MSRLYPEIMAHGMLIIPRDQLDSILYLLGTSSIVHLKSDGLEEPESVAKDIDTLINKIDYILKEYNSLDGLPKLLKPSPKASFSYSYQNVYKAVTTLHSKIAQIVNCKIKIKQKQKILFETLQAYTLLSETAEEIFLEQHDDMNESHCSNVSNDESIRSSSMTSIGGEGNFSTISRASSSALSVIKNMRTILDDGIVSPNCSRDVSETESIYFKKKVTQALNRRLYKPRTRFANSLSTRSCSSTSTNIERYDSNQKVKSTLQETTMFFPINSRLIHSDGVSESEQRIVNIDCFNKNILYHNSSDSDSSDVQNIIKMTDDVIDNISKKTKLLNDNLQYDMRRVNQTEKFCNLFESDQFTIRETNEKEIFNPKYNKQNFRNSKYKLHSKKPCITYEDSVYKSTKNQRSKSLNSSIDNIYLNNMLINFGDSYESRNASQEPFAAKKSFPKGIIKNTTHRSQSRTDSTDFDSTQISGSSKKIKPTEFKKSEYKQVFIFDNSEDSSMEFNLETQKTNKIYQKIEKQYKRLKSQNPNITKFEESAQKIIDATKMQKSNKPILNTLPLSQNSNHNKLLKINPQSSCLSLSSDSCSLMSSTTYNSESCIINSKKVVWKHPTVKSSDLKIIIVIIAESSLYMFEKSIWRATRGQALVTKHGEIYSTEDTISNVLSIIFHSSKSIINSDKALKQTTTKQSQFGNLALPVAAPRSVTTDIANSTGFEALIFKLAFIYHARIIPFGLSLSEVRRESRELGIAMRLAVTVLVAQQTLLRSLLSSLAQCDTKKNNYLLSARQFLKQKSLVLEEARKFKKINLTGQFVKASCWVPATKIGELRELIKKVSPNSLSVFLEIDTVEIPPTYIRCSEQLEVYKKMISTYGITCHNEISPIIFTAVTFPFLFGLMFSDVFHGALLTLLGILIHLIREEAEPKIFSVKSKIKLAKLKNKFFIRKSGKKYTTAFRSPQKVFASKSSDEDIEVLGKPSYDVKKIKYKKRTKYQKLDIGISSDDDIKSYSTQNTREITKTNLTLKEKFNLFLRSTPIKILKSSYKQFLKLLKLLKNWFYSTFLALYISCQYEYWVVAISSCCKQHMSSNTIKEIKKLRVMILSMGLCSMFSGLMYSECFGVGISIGPSSWVAYKKPIPRGLIEIPSDIKPVLFEWNPLSGSYEKSIHLNLVKKNKIPYTKSLANFNRNLILKDQSNVSYKKTERDKNYIPYQINNNNSIWISKSPSSINYDLPKTNFDLYNTKALPVYKLFKKIPTKMINLDDCHYIIKNIENINRQNYIINTEILKNYSKNNLIDNDKSKLSLNAVVFPNSVRTVFTKQIHIDNQRSLESITYVPNSSRKPIWFGLDPAWRGATNELAFINSLRMKLSILFGIAHMSLGICLNWINHLRRKEYIKIFTVVAPQSLFFFGMFGYMFILILHKWVTVMPVTESPQRILSNNTTSNVIQLINTKSISLYSWRLLSNSKDSFKRILLSVDKNKEQGYNIYNSVAHSLEKVKNHKMDPVQRKHHPGILMIFINLFLGKLTSSYINLDVFKNQVIFDSIVFIMVIASALLLFFAHPVIIVLKKKFSGIKKENNENSDSTIIDHVIEHIVESMEFILGTISHVASYLRLWALALAHGSLSLVFLRFIITNNMTNDIPLSVIKLLVMFPLWLITTIGLLMMVDALECMLHTVRLHWVEFQSKFYRGTGIEFESFSFKHNLEK